MVRNPYDAIDLYWNMCSTNNHTKYVMESVYATFRDVWEGLVVNEMNVFCEFYKWWMTECEQKDVPLLIVLYKDLIGIRKVEVLQLIIAFCNLHNSALSDAYFQREIAILSELNHPNIIHTVIIFPWPVGSMSQNARIRNIALGLALGQQPKIW